MLEIILFLFFLILGINVIIAFVGFLGISHAAIVVLLLWLIISAISLLFRR